MTKRNCKYCGVAYPATSDFFSYGRFCVNKISYTCKKCSNTQKCIWKQKTGNTSTFYYKKNHPPLNKGKDLNIWRVSLLIHNNILKRSRKKHIIYDSNLLTRTYIYNRLCSQQACECCNVKLDFSQKKIHNNISPTIDRVIPNQGYVENNLAVLCHRCNRLKNNALLSELENLLNWMRNEMQ